MKQEGIVCRSSWWGKWMSKISRARGGVKRLCVWILRKISDVDFKIYGRICRIWGVTIFVDPSIKMYVNTQNFETRKYSRRSREVRYLQVVKRHIYLHCKCRSLIVIIICSHECLFSQFLKRRFSVTIVIICLRRDRCRRYDSINNDNPYHPSHYARVSANLLPFLFLLCFHKWQSLPSERDTRSVLQLDARS